MDFDKTSFFVDLYTPTCATSAQKRVSFPKSARISIDDFSIDSPLSDGFDAEDTVIDQPCAYSVASSYLQSLQGPRWPHSAPPSKSAFTDCEAYPLYEPRSQSCDYPAGWRALASLGLDFVVDDGAFCGPDFDWSWLDALDEQLLVSPIECFTELCWAATVDEEGCMPTRHKKNARSCARSFTCESKSSFPAWTTRDHPAKAGAPRPLVAKITLPHETHSQYLSSPSSESCFTPSPTSERMPMDFLYTDPFEHGIQFPVQPVHTKCPRRFLGSQNFDIALPSDPSERSYSRKPRLRASRSTGALRVVTDAYTSFTGGMKKSPVAP